MGETGLGGIQYPDFGSGHRRCLQAVTLYDGSIRVASDARLLIRYASRACPDQCLLTMSLQGILITSGTMVKWSFSYRVAEYERAIISRNGDTNPLLH